MEEIKLREMEIGEVEIRSADDFMHWNKDQKYQKRFTDFPEEMYYKYVQKCYTYPEILKLKLDKKTFWVAMRSGTADSEYIFEYEQSGEIIVFNQNRGLGYMGVAVYESYKDKLNNSELELVGEVFIDRDYEYDPLEAEFDKMEVDEFVKYLLDKFDCIVWHQEENYERSGDM